MRLPALAFAAISPLAIALGPLASAEEVGAIPADQLTVSAPKAARGRPLVVVVAENAGAELTDFVVPFGVLRDSGVAEVRSLSTGSGPVQLLRNIKIVADQTINKFDKADPSGADVVIVPAQMDPNDPILSAWLQGQAERGATIISICEGARVLAAAGLLKGKSVVTHWSAMDELAKKYPETTWVRDRRYLQDGRFASTTGVSASLPMSLALVEAIGGSAVAQATAARFGIQHWSSTHHTAGFSLGAWDYARAVVKLGAVWNHETFEAPLADGIDEVALAIRADTWSRSLQTTVVTTREGRSPVRSLRGLVIIPDDEPQAGRDVLPGVPMPAAEQMDDALAEMRRRYGEFAVRMAVMGMEYDPILHIK